jgi:hypothetical protein
MATKPLNQILKLLKELTPAELDYLDNALWAEVNSRDPDYFNFSSTDQDIDDLK